MSHSEAKKKWHVAYTYPNAEKKVHKLLINIGVTSFLPMLNVISKWSDRTKQVQLPLFPNYIFINVSPKDLYVPLQIKQLLYYVSFDGKAAIVNDTLVESLKKILNGEGIVSEEEYTKAGMPVKVIHGPFAGVEGVVIKKNGKTKLVVQIEAMKRAISVEISSNMIAPIYSHD